RNKIKKTAYYHDVLRNRTANSLEITLGENEGERVNSIITPILSNEMTYGFISLMETSAKMSDIDLIALKHGATALTLQLMKQIIHKQTTQSKYIALVDDLVNGRIHTDIVNEYLLSKHEWDKLMNVAVIDTKINENKETYTYTAWDRSEFRVTEIIKSHLSKCF